MRTTIGIAILILLGLVGLVFYGESLPAPPHQAFEQVLPDAQFPH